MKKKNQVPTIRLMREFIGLGKTGLVYVVEYPNGKTSYCWGGRDQAERKVQEFVEKCGMKS